MWHLATVLHILTCNIFTQIQDDEKEQNILLLNEKIAQLEKELAQSRSSAVIHHEKTYHLLSSVQI